MTITKTNTSYQYLRLNDGKELFAMVKEVDDQLELHFPMNILCKPAMTGGVTIHLGPFVPFTTDDSMIIDSSEVVVRTSITDQFIDLYDQSITTWLDMRDNDHIQIKTKKQDLEDQQKEFAQLIRDKISRIRKEEMWEDFNDEDDFFELEHLPTDEDIIH
jgi:hypothetical protein|tara:strand:- start:714 stop:1193 length:480 start_codon:yes stop_codon:yes gene_type:complete